MLTATVAFNESGSTVIPNLYSSDLATSELFQNLKKWFSEKRFGSNDKITARTNACFEVLDKCMELKDKIFSLKNLIQIFSYLLIHPRSVLSVAL